MINMEKCSRTKFIIVIITKGSVQMPKKITQSKNQLNKSRQVDFFPPKCFLQMNMLSIYEFSRSKNSPACTCHCTTLGGQGHCQWLQAGIHNATGHIHTIMSVSCHFCQFHCSLTQHRLMTSSHHCDTRKIQLLSASCQCCSGRKSYVSPCHHLCDYHCLSYPHVTV